MRAYRNIVMTAFCALTAFNASSCKMRTARPSDESTKSDTLSTSTGNGAGGLDISKAPLFVKCTAPKEAAQSFELSLSQDKASGLAGITYRHGDNEASAVSTTGRWDNFNEPNAYQFLYSFGELRLIMTQDQIAGGFYPATFVGVDAAKQYIEQNLMCSKV